MNIFEPSSYRETKITQTDIPGLLVIALAVHQDGRGWFKENFQREKFVSLGFPANFEIAQNNIGFYAQRGVTKGIHAEPWDKYIAVASGSLFAAIVDLRAGDNFGKVATFELNPGIALFVPKGCANSFQTLEADTSYTSMVNGHDNAEAKYTAVNLSDPDLAIQWPIPLEWAEISDTDRSSPFLKQTRPIQ